MATRVNPPKKVRLACRRCRDRRIKCDGEVPACTNCAKAGAVCLDVDKQNSGLLVPRNFAGSARARIQWLEAIIREHLPDVDLTLGPQVNSYSEPSASSAAERDNQQGDDDDDDGRLSSPAVSGAPRSLSQGRTPSSTPRASLKRPAEAASSAEHDESIPEQAHSVAMNLGMLSLNSDSSQRHYLGSSSGLLFTNLIGASPSTPGSSYAADAETFQAARAEWFDDGAAIDLTRQYYRSLHAFLKQELPRKEDALVLVHTYIRWVHPDYPVLEPSSLISGLNALYSCASQLAEDDPYMDGWPTMLETFRWNGRPMTPHDRSQEHVSMPVIAFIIFMVFNIAAIVKVRSRHYEYPPERYYHAAAHFSKHAFSHISLSSIQALVCLIVHSIFTPSDVSLWTLIHIGLAHCVELGTHREQPATTASDIAYQQIRKFVFYTIYSLDRSVSSIQGRPLGFRDETFDIKMPDPQGSDAGYMDESIPFSFSVAVTRYATSHFELDRIVSSIKLLFYHLPGTSTWFPQTKAPLEDQERIRVSLDEWWARTSGADFAPGGLDDRQRRIWQLKLKVRYHSTMVMLFQPSQVIREPSSESLQICFNHASAILYEYRMLHDLHGIHHGWRTVQNIFAAGATLIYSFWTSSIVRRNASTADLSRSLRTCSNLLTLGGEWWPSVKKGQTSFGSLADLTIRKLYTENTPSKHPRLQGHDIVAAESNGISRTSGTSSQTQPIFEKPQIGSYEQPAWYDPALSTPYNQEAWHGAAYQSIESTVETGISAEIESFLADFDRSEFSWSFPLNDLGDEPGIGHVPSYLD
ncbi:Aconitate hydratase [Pleurostoma richardsiae]|uniref:Aconitate hydratase n=1 Tax=Pleurostoma richardsiae TaxID=41990 RepID=A0AA38RKP6_9PEZI|nr:Aconitate hydratase [Pleurostoma richardsiae]